MLSLKSLEQGQSLLVPRFDKATDDRCTESEWTRVIGPVDLIIFEGWRVGAEPVADEELSIAINDLEESEDPDGIWRNYVNQQLRDVYPPLFAMLDALVFMSAPDFDCVLRWRTEQEKKLLARTGESQTRVMTGSQIERFIQHYERITRQNLAAMPASADVRLELGQDHQVRACHGIGDSL